MTATKPLFDRKKRRILKNNAKRMLVDDCPWLSLAREWAQDLRDILQDIASFQKADAKPLRTLLLGWNLCASLPDVPFPVERGALSHVVCADLCEPSCPILGVSNVLVDEEQWCFQQNAFHRIISVMGLHAVNDLPKLFRSVEYSLRDGGVFVALFPGAENMLFFRHQLLGLEQKLCGGVAHRCLPMLHLRDGGDLLQKAGFVNILAERRRWIIEGQNTLMDMCRMLQTCGETSILQARPMTRNLWRHLSLTKMHNTRDIENVTLIGYKASASKSSGKESAKPRITSDNLR